MIDVNEKRLCKSDRDSDSESDSVRIAIHQLPYTAPRVVVTECNWGGGV